MMVEGSPHAYVPVYVQHAHSMCVRMCALVDCVLVWAYVNRWVQGNIFVYSVLNA